MLKPDRGKGGRMAEIRSEEDPRIRKTRRALVQAYLDLCAEGGGESATVASIAERAEVNRATFYRHFEDKEDLAERGLGLYLGELLAEIDPGSAYRTHQLSLPPNDPDPRDRIRARVERFFQVLQDKASLFRPLLAGRGGSRIFLGIEEYFSAYLRESRLVRLSGVRLTLPEPLAARALSMMILGIAASWLQDARGLSPKDMARAYVDFLFEGLFKVPGAEDPLMPSAAPVGRLSGSAGRPGSD
jgi:AcrR family transcriptional regulator